MDTLGIRKGLLLIEVYVQWRIQGRGPGGPAPLIFEVANSRDQL